MSYVDKVRIVVKGDRGQTEAALASRGLTGELVAENKLGSTFWDVPLKQGPAVVTWGCEGGTCPEGGFPIGTLLYHAEIRI